MKIKLGWMRRMLWLVPAMQACGEVPFYDGFDAAPYGPGTNFLTSINGWASGSTNVQVTASVCDTAPNSVQLVGLASLSNTVGGVGGQIWTDFRVRPVFGAPPPDLPAPGTISLTAYFGTNRFFAYAANGDWQVCSNTVWGQPVSALTSGQFARITIYQDYTRSNSALFVNSNLVAQDIRFYGISSAYQGFMAQGGAEATTSHLDTVNFTYSPPADMLIDANGDGVLDVNELALYGYAMRTLVVATNAAYTNLQVAVDAARARDVMVVSNDTYAGNVTISHAVGAITGGVFTIGGTLAIGGSGVAITARVGFACGDLNVSSGNVLVVNGALTAANLTLGTNAGLTVANALAASNVTLNAGAYLAAGSLTVTGTVSVSTSAVLVVNGQIVGSNLTVNGGFSLGAGGMITCTNLTLGPGVTVSLTNATVTVAHLAIGTGAQLVVSNSTVTADGLVLSGTFTLDSNWGNSQAQSAIPFRDGFEPYAAGLALTNYGFNGWGASDPSVMVESQTVAVGAKAVTIPRGQSASNRVSGVGATKVWTDVRIQPVLGDQPLGLLTNTSTCVFYFDTNGYVVVNSSSNGWNTCSSNAVGASVTNRASTNRFVRMTVRTDFGKRQSALFLDGELLREQIPFGAGAPAFYSGLKVDNQVGGVAYMDEVNLAVNAPADLYGDIDGDNVNDLTEIDRFGSIMTVYSGAVFKFR